MYRLLILLLLLTSCSTYNLPYKVHTIEDRYYCYYCPICGTINACEYPPNDKHVYTCVKCWAKFKLL